MNFARGLAIKNIKRKPFRAAAMAVIVMLLSFTLFAGAYTIISLQRGLDSYQARLGADIVVVPNSSKGHGTVDDVLLSGITGNYYMNGKDCSKVAETEGVASVSRQFFLTSAKASCCSSRVQIIGFEPENDFTVMPWINEDYDGDIGDGEIIVGSNISMPNDRKIKFYGNYYHVAAQLRETGTGLDSAVYANMNTIREMADSAADLFGSEMFKGVDADSGASALMIKVADGYEIGAVTDDINIHVTKVEATPVKSMIETIAKGLGSISTVTGWLVAGIWMLSLIILIVSFALLANERKKEMAVLRVMGASKKILSQVMSMEAAIISAIGAAVGIALAMLITLPAAESLGKSLELPMLRPGAGSVIGLAFAAMLISVAAGLLTSYIFARKIGSNETSLLLREDA